MAQGEDSIFQTLIALYTRVLTYKLPEFSTQEIRSTAQKTLILHGFDTLSLLAIAITR